MLANRYGHFTADGRAFEITDHRTPMPWTNVICNGRYGLIVSQNGGGFSWFDDAQHCVLTRWEMDMVRDTHGKFLYLSDLESQDVWSLTPAPTWQEIKNYSCTHAVGATYFKGESHEIASEWTLTVHPSEQAEVWLVKLTNKSSKPRKLRLMSYFEWTCGVAPDAKREFHRLFFTTSHDPKRRAVIATKNMWDIPPKHERHHWNQPWPYVAAHMVAGMKFERDIALADKTAFLGRYGQSFKPEAMTRSNPGDGRFGRFGDAAAALGGDFTLQPGQSVSLHYIIAISSTHAELMGALDRLQDPSVAAATPAASSAMWDKVLGATKVESKRQDFDLLNNTWLRYQAVSGRIWGRTGYYQQSGAFGFRDQLQDSHVWLPTEPQRCLDHILLAAGRQFVDGSVNHWWHPLADFGNHTACSDDYLWLPMLVSSYMKETGDMAFVKGPLVGFRDDPHLRTDLLDHCLRSFRRAFSRFSPRGIPLIGSCDWNDGLSAMGVEERGESVWLGWFLAYLLRDWVTILNRLGQVGLAEEFADRREKLLAAINQHAWDGAWYRYGTKDNGDPVGSAQSPEGKIHLNAQTWSIISDGATPQRAVQAWSSVKERLLSPFGPLLLEPAYTVPDGSIGYITRYSPGSRENGGVYMHAATWALLCACKVKDHASAEKIWNSITPPMRCGADAEAYWAEPYVLPGNVDGPLSEIPGKAGWTWYSGSAAWLNKVSLEWVLGIRPELEGLRIDPCAFASLGKVRAQRMYRGRLLKLSFDATTCEPGRSAVVTINGQVLEGGLLTGAMLNAIPAGQEVAIEVRWLAGAAVESKGVEQSSRKH